MSETKRARTVLLTTMIPYSLWLLFYETAILLGLPELPAETGYYAALGAAFISVVIICFRLPGLKYSPLIMILAFIAAGRLAAFSAGFASRHLDGGVLFRLPFGGLDVYLFCFLALGMFGYIDNNKHSSAASVSATDFIPIVIFTAPVFLELVPGAGLMITLYSFLFTSVLVITALFAARFLRRHPEMKMPAVAVLLSIAIDASVYLYRSPLASYLPAGLVDMLFPYPLFIMAAFSAASTKEEMHD